MRELVIGHDHGFGRGRSGDVETLRRLGEQYGFEVDVVPPVDCRRAARLQLAGSAGRWPAAISHRGAACWAGRTR